MCEHYTQREHSSKESHDNFSDNFIETCGAVPCIFFKHVFTSHSCMNLFTSSGDALLCLLNSSFTYWSPRAFRSIGRNRCRTRILLYRERTLDMWAEAAMLEHDVNSIFTENSNNNKSLSKKDTLNQILFNVLVCPGNGRFLLVWKLCKRRLCCSWWAGAVSQSSKNNFYYMMTDLFSGYKKLWKHCAMY